MKKQLLIDINAIVQSTKGNIKDISFHKNAITMISKISRDLGYELILSPSERTDAADYIRHVLASENVALGSADETASDNATTSIVSGISDINNDTTIVFDAASNTWSDILHTLKGQSRKVSHQRITKETQISIELNPDGEGKADISTGLHFFDHMLDQIARHGSLDLRIHAKGDLHIDEHHTIEDTAITLGETFAIALGDKRGIERYGFCLPMDDALAQVAIDFGGRNWIVWDAKFSREKIGDVPTEMFYHFFKSFSDSAKCNLNIQVTGDNEHHKIEAIFKAFAKAIKMAVRRDLDNMQLPSTKGLL